MLRALSLLLVGLILAGVLLDPYTLHHDASDAVRRGPWWQLLLGLADVALLVGTLLMVQRRRYDRAAVLLGAEALWAIGAALILVRRDGMARFIRGFGAEPYFTEYLVLMALRCVALVLLWFATRYTGRRADTAH